MIHWCSYCQSFLGEVEPFDSMRITHGMCSECYDSGALERKPSPQLRAVGRFLADAVGRTQSGLPPTAEELLRGSKRLGIRQADLLVGVLQPVLYEVGRAFERGDIRPAQEHRMSLEVERLLAGLTVDALDTASGTGHFLLCPMDGNAHTIGPTIFGLLCAEAGIAVHLIPSTDRLQQQIEQLAGAASCEHFAVGLSAALPAQVAAAEDLSNELKRRLPGLRVLLGGYATKGYFLKPSSFDMVPDPRRSRECARALASMLTPR